MEALLRQSRSMCPFLKKTSPATLRSLSTTSAHNASPGGGRMSNLQVLARRCPVMGKALAVQSSHSGNAALAGAYGGVRAYHSKVDRAQFHSVAPKEAQAVDVGTIRKNQGTLV
jgi:5-aminolevulinate synthase